MRTRLETWQRGRRGHLVLRQLEKEVGQGQSKACCPFGITCPGGGGGGARTCITWPLNASCCERVRPGPSLHPA